MSLNKEFFSRETNISAKVIADNISEKGVRITTLEVEAPRIILAEINTHNAISKNCSSSRAIPITKMLQQVKYNGFTPLYWGSKKSGMQAGDELFGDELATTLGYWEAARNGALLAAENMEKNNLHKQLANRVTEPFQMVKQVLTATDWDNFFNLRIHPTAQPEILMLAYKIYKAMEESTPQLLKEGDWHLPYINRQYDGYTTWLETDSKNPVVVDTSEAVKYSIARCASVSYRTEDMSLEKAQEIYTRLLEADVLHSSPAEHLATPVSKEVEIENSDYLTVGFINKASDSDTWEDGITHMNKQGELCSGNFRGWVQYRHTLKGNTCWKFDFEERMTMFE